MPNRISCRIHKSKLKPEEPVNILTICAHERYENLLSKANCNIFAFQHPSCKTWNTKFGPVPKNYRIFDMGLGDLQIPQEIDFDCCLSHSIHFQWPLLRQFADEYDIPLISLEHCIPDPCWPPHHIEVLKERKSDISVYITDYSIGAWGHQKDDSHVSIYHAIDTGVFSYVDGVRINNVLTVVNDLMGRGNVVGAPIWLDVNKALNNTIRLVGDNKGMSEPASSLEVLAKEYQSAKIFFNTTLSSTIPMAVLEAMACGAAIVTTGTGAIPEIIKHEENGLIYNSTEEAIHQIRFLLANEDKRKFLADNALRTIQTKFTIDRFIAEWNQVLNRIR